MMPRVCRTSVTASVEGDQGVGASGEAAGQPVGRGCARVAPQNLPAARGVFGYAAAITKRAWRSRRNRRGERITPGLLGLGHPVGVRRRSRATRQSRVRPVRAADRLSVHRGRG
jgi:transposase InsO family protein